MHIRWSTNRIAEQHLEGDCSNLEKLKVEIHAVDQVDEGHSTVRLLRVHHIESISDGTLRIYVDPRKESS